MRRTAQEFWILRSFLRVVLKLLLATHRGDRLRYEVINLWKRNDKSSARYFILCDLNRIGKGPKKIVFGFHLVDLVQPVINQNNKQFISLRIKNEFCSPALPWPFFILSASIMLMLTFTPRN